jgi:hypothetical protein
MAVAVMNWGGYQQITPILHLYVDGRPWDDFVRWHDRLTQGLWDAFHYGTFRPGVAFVAVKDGSVVRTYFDTAQLDRYNCGRFIYYRLLPTGRVQLLYKREAWALGAGQDFCPCCGQDGDHRQLTYDPSTDTCG